MQIAYLFCKVLFVDEYDFVEVEIGDFSIFRKPVRFKNDENIFVVAQNRTKFGFVRTQMTQKRPRVDLEWNKLFYKEFKKNGVTSWMQRKLQNRQKFT